MSGKYSINKPHLYDKNWNIFPQTILSNLDLDDCNDTVNGFCEDTSTLKECIDICQNDPLKLCDGGYFIEAHDRNYCVPLSSTTSEPSYPYFRFRNADAYPELKNVKTTSFINAKYKFPPNMTTRLFYMDNIVIQNPQTKLQVSRDLNNPTNTEIFLSDKDYINVQFVPKMALRTTIERYIPILNGDSLAINIPHTGLILEDTNKGMNWLLRLNNTLHAGNTFKIFSKDPKKKIGDPLNYTEEFYFLSSGNSPIIIDKNTMKLGIQNKDKNFYFKLIPNVKVYYCDNGECKTVNLKDTEMNGVSATYKNSHVYRMPQCWNRCKKNGVNWQTVLLICIVVLLLIISIYIYNHNK